MLHAQHRQQTDSSDRIGTSSKENKVVKYVSQIRSTPTTPLPIGRSQLNTILYDKGEFLSFQYCGMTHLHLDELHKSVKSQNIML